MVVGLDVLPRLGGEFTSAPTFAVAIFPFLSLISMGVLVLRSDHKRRLDEIATGKAERAEARRQAAIAKKQEKERLEAERHAKFTECRVCGKEWPRSYTTDGKCTLCNQRSKGIGHSLPLDLSLEVLNRDDWTCYYCGKDVKEVGPRERHLDHFIPQSEGGVDLVDNLVTSCSTCNTSKNDRMPSRLEIWQFKIYLKAKAAGSDKKSQILAIASSNNGEFTTTQKEIAGLLKVSQGYVSSVLRNAERIEADNGQ